MSCEDGDCAHSWHYAPYRGLRGELERGRGIAVARLRDRPERSDLVYECTSRDTRWDWQVDDRYTYSARLLRDLRLDPTPLVERLRACGPDGSADDDNQFDLAVGILEALARGGGEQAREALRDYVRDGIRWLDALTALAYGWPVRWWDDLWEDVAGRVDADHTKALRPSDEPWQRWRGRDPRLDRVLDAAARDRPDTSGRRRTLTTASDAELVALLRAAGDDRSTLALILGRIRHRGRPVAELLDVVEQIAPIRPAGLFGALRALGPDVVPAARTWAREPDHPLFHDAPRLLAAHGDEDDLPSLLAALGRMTDDWCGHDVLTEGIARILIASGPGTHVDARAAVVGRVRWLANASPHSYERASYLRTLLLLDPERTTVLMPIHLLDCEPRVRLLAAQHTPLTDDARQWLAELRDDPIEDEDIRQAAGARVNKG